LLLATTGKKIPPHPSPLPPRGEGIFASQTVFQSLDLPVEIQEIKYKEATIRGSGLEL
jgi:hypothetical protein